MAQTCFNTTVTFNASIQGDAINAVNAILEIPYVQEHCLWGAQTNASVIEQRDAVENVKINQVSVLSLEMFRDIDGCLNSGVQKPLTILNGLTGI
jgi:hypothetical protein